MAIDEVNTDARERILFENYTKARNEKDRLATLKTQAEEELAKAEQEIITFLEDMGKKSTGKYTDLGTLVVNAPTPRPRYDKENEAEVWEFVRSNGGEACIKETLNAQTFSSFVKEQIAKGVVIPTCVEIYYQPSVKWLKPKE